MKKIKLSRKFGGTYRVIWRGSGVSLNQRVLDATTRAGQCPRVLRNGDTMPSGRGPRTKNVELRRDVR